MSEERKEQIEKMELDLEAYEKCIELIKDLLPEKPEDIEEFPLEQDEVFCKDDLGPVNPEVEKENFLIINCGDSTDTSV